MTWSRTIASLAFTFGFFGCAGGSDPMLADTDTEGSSTSTMSATSPTTTSTTAPPTTTSTTTSTTTDPSTSSSSTGPADSSSTSDGTSTTDEPTTTGECVPRTEGCPCAPDADPECGDGLACMDDICVPVDCDAQTAEPNDNPFEPAALELPKEGLGMLDAEIDGDDDVDWWRYSCDDPLLSSIEPILQAGKGDNPRICMFIDCQQGGNPFFDCPEGTVEVNAPIDNLPGCCMEDVTNFQVTGMNCPDSSNDAVDVYIRVDEGSAGVCSEYSLGFGCE